MLNEGIWTAGWSRKKKKNTWHWACVFDRKAGWMMEVSAAHFDSPKPASPICPVYVVDSFYSTIVASQPRRIATNGPARRRSRQ